MLDTSAFLLPEVLEYFNGGLIPQRRGNDHAAGTPLNTYPSRDGYVTVAVASDKDWGCLLAALGREDLIGDKRFTDRLARREHIDEIEEMVSNWISERTSDDAVNILQTHQVAAGPVQTLPEMTESVQLQERDMIVGLSHPNAGPITGTKGFGMPIRFTDNPLSFDQPAPELGAHTDEVYGRLLGLDSDAIDELRRKGVI
jgi:crotonobetainyl-CoA:carnitine CoA-transferase CaiB-like acyl-CoA transferase